MIVTANLRDFPAEALMPFEIEAQHPDEFIVHLTDLLRRASWWRLRTGIGKAWLTILKRSTRICRCWSEKA